MPEAIAISVELKDRALRASSQAALGPSLSGFSTSDRAAAQGRQVNSLVDFRAVLQDVRFLPERPGLRTQEPPGPQAEGFRLLAAALVGQLQVRPEAAQGPAFFSLLQDCRSLAPEQHAVMLKALTDEIRSLPEPVWLPAVRGILAAAESLAPEQRWAVLKPLGQEVHRLPVAAQSSTWQAVVRSVLAVPPGQLAAALAAMTDQINTLNDDENVQLPAVRLMPAVLQESLAWLRRGKDLPLEPRTTMLLMLAHGLADLPPAVRPAVFRRALRSTPLLGPEHRGPLLMDLAKAIEALSQAARQPAWQAALQAVEQLPPPQGVFPLAILVGQMGGLPVDAQATAFESVRQAHRRLPAQYHGLSVEVLGTGCLALPHVQWPHALDRVLEELARLPEPLRRVNVLGLATKFCQAEPAANGPIDPRQPDKPGLDLRLQCLDKVLEAMPPPPHPSEDFLECVNALNNEMRQRLQQRPDDAAFLTEVLERIRRLMGAGHRHVQPVASRNDAGESC
jgi:hypothetical protein